jgi:hypothetical protein
MEITFYPKIFEKRQDFGSLTRFFPVRRVQVMVFVPFRADKQASKTTLDRPQPVTNSI